jgi:outer membrane receptor protein involved in Fe transport
MGRYLLGSALSALVLSSTAVAQDVQTTPGSDANEIAAAEDTIVVTGSRIARPNLDNTTPTVVLGEAALEAQGFENFADIATTMPQFAPSFGNSRTASSFSGSAASGLNLANLRNLSGLRTVVLLNGRRVPGGTSISTAVDFNTLPTANIERIEVITGGASAIYGADAVAGVVNILTKKSFEGLEVGASYGIAEAGDNKNPSAYVMFGSGMGDGGRVTLTTQYTYEGLVSCADRYLCAQDIIYNNPDTGIIRGPAAFSGVGLGGNFFAGSSGSLTRDASGNFVPFVVSEHGFNRNPERTLAIPTRRLMFAAEADYPITDSIEAFAEVNYGRSSTNAPIEAIAFQSTSNTFGANPATALRATIPLNIQQTVNGVTTTVPNPIIPAAVRARLTPAQIASGQLAWSQRLSELGKRGATNDRNTVRVATGLRGEYGFLGDSPWNWEASYIYGRTELDSQTNGVVGTDGLYYGLRTELVDGTLRCADPGARATGCVPVNPFAPYTQAMRDYLTVDVGQNGISTLHDAVAYTSGSLFELPAGPVSAAVGVEYRTFSGFQDADEPLNRGTTTSNTIFDTAFSKTKTQEAYAELIVPVLRDVPGVNMLELEGAYRISDSNRTDSYSTWRYGGTWEPFDGLRFRTTRAKAVRAPTPSELGGGGQSFGNVQDPCTAANRNANATRAANCAADGVPANYNPPNLVLQGVGGLTGGNPDLQPEEAKTWTYGFVFTPTFLPGFSLTVDRFQIDIDGLINFVGRQNKINLCYDTVERQYCGDLTRSFRPEVGGNYALTGVNDQLANVNKFKLRGLDVEARYAFEIDAPFSDEAGRVSLQAISTIYDKAEQTETTGAVTKLDGYAGGDTSTQGFLRWQATGNFGYQAGAFGMNYNLRYIPKTKASPFIDPDFPKISDAWYHNVRLSYAVSEKAEVYFGINNLADNQPPIVPDNSAGSQAQNTISGFYDVFGRSYYTGLTFKF